MTANWKYTSDKQDVVMRTHDNGSMESCLVTRDDVQAWIAEGNTPDPTEGQ